VQYLLAIIIVVVIAAEQPTASTMSCPDLAAAKTYGKTLLLHVVDAICESVIELLKKQACNCQAFHVHLGRCLGLCMPYHEFPNSGSRTWLRPVKPNRIPQ
jgi:hypothetical protein